MKIKILADFFESIKNKQSTLSPSTSFSFEVRSWGEYMENIEKWQKENAREQWPNAKFSHKPLYRYSWESNVRQIKFKPEPKNEYDEYAIEVHLDNYKIGYIPNPTNKKHYKALLSSKEIKADIHGGKFKQIDEYGDLIVGRKDPVVKITVSI